MLSGEVWGEHGLGQSFSLPNTPTRKALFPVSTKGSVSPAPDLEVPSVPLQPITLNKSHLSLCALPHCASESVVFDPNDVF